MTRCEALLGLWRRLLDLSAARQPRLNNDEVESVQMLVTGLPSDLLPPSDWLDLVRLCVGLGLFQVANTLREKALDRMIIEAGSEKAGTQAYSQACYACLERGEIDQARIWLARLSDSGCEPGRLTQAAWFVALMSDNDCPSDSFPPKPVEEEAAFGQLVESRDIALVGPVASKVLQGPDIDEQDLVVKFGYRGGNHGCDPEFQGKRIDISYYNNNQARALAQDDFQSVFKALRWAVCHNRKGAACFQPVPANLRQVQTLQWFLPDTHLNAGPNAIIDLLRFRPASIRVYNTDLMLSSGRFAGYREAGNEETDYTRSFIKTHDPILQYRIMNRLWAAGRIDGDRRFVEVMEMGLDGYLSELQKAYGAVDRALF